MSTGVVTACEPGAVVLEDWDVAALLLSWVMLGSAASTAPAVNTAHLLMLEYTVRHAGQLFAELDNHHPSMQSRQNRCSQRGSWTTGVAGGNSPKVDRQTKQLGPLRALAVMQLLVLLVSLELLAVLADLRSSCRVRGRYTLGSATRAIGCSQRSSCAAAMRSVSPSS